MNKIIKGLIIEIFFFSLVIVGSIFTFPNLKEENLKKTEAILAYSNKLSINKVDENNYNLFPMTDEYAINNLKYNTLKVTNMVNKDIDYELFLVIDKKSTLNVENIRIKVDDKIDYISNTLSYEDEDCFYYLLSTKKINNNSYNMINYIIWLDDKTQNVNGNLNYAFEVREI